MLGANPHGSVTRSTSARLILRLPIPALRQPWFPMEDFEAGLGQLEKQELKPINHNLVHYRDFIFAKS